MVHHHHHHLILINIHKLSLERSSNMGCPMLLWDPDFGQDLPAESYDGYDAQRSSVNLTQSIILGWTRMKHETTKLEPFPIDFSISVNWYQFISIPIDFLISINSRILIINGNWSSFFDQKHPRLRTNGIHISYTPIGPTMSQVCVDSLLNHGFVKFLGRFSCVSFFRKGLLWTNKHDFKTIYIKTAATSMKPHCKSLAVSPRIMGMCNSCSVPSGISQPCFITDHFQNGNPNIMD